MRHMASNGNEKEHLITHEHHLSPIKIFNIRLSQLSNVQLATYLLINKVLPMIL
jgi:hypothetical protein